MNTMLKDINIIIIDDDFGISHSIISSLKQMEVSNIMSTDSARVALKKIDSSAEPIDIIIFGLYAKDLDAIEFISNLGDLPQSCSLILISGVNEYLCLTIEEMIRRHNLNLLGRLRPPIYSASLYSLLNKHQEKTYTQKKYFNTLYLEIELQRAIKEKTI